MTTPLQIAAQHLIDRWDSPLWKDQPHTGVYIAELRKALEAEQVQTVDPVATVQCINGVTIGYLDAMQPVGTKLYLHPAPPADDFDTWQKNPYTLILQKSIAEDYVPKQAQQVAVLEKREPLNRVDILNMHALRCWPRTMFADKSYGIALDTVTVVDFVRIIEAHHGIGAKP